MIDKPFALGYNHMVSLMATAFTLAAASKASRRACAALLVNLDHNKVPYIESSGVNGTAPGTSNQCEPECKTYTYDHVIHAEVNCLSRSPRICDTTMLFITDSPCEQCLALIQEHSIKYVVYCRGYRIQEHLADSSVLFCKVDEADVSEFLSLAADRISSVIV